MDWSALQTAIATAVTDATGLTNAQWRGAATAARWKGAPASVDLTLRHVDAVGRDEDEQAYDDGADTVSITRKGQRQATVTVRIESDSGTPGESAQHYASLLRTRLWRESVLAALDAAGLGVVEIHPSADGELIRDGRRVSVVITDVLFSAYERDTDTTATGDVIHSAQATSEYLRDVDGTNYPHQVSIDTNG